VCNCSIEECMFPYLSLLQAEAPVMGRNNESETRACYEIHANRGKPWVVEKWYCRANVVICGTKKKRSRKEIDVLDARLHVIEWPCGMVVTLIQISYPLGPLTHCYVHKDTQCYARNFRMLRFAFLFWYWLRYLTQS
jgi:hypothetical protein